MRQKMIVWNYGLFFFVLCSILACSPGEIALANIPETVSIDNVIYTVIAQEADFQKIRDNLAGNYYLYRDIVLTSNNFEPIGDTTTPFIGVFEGNEKAISGLSINRKTEDYIGLFRQIGYPGTDPNHDPETNGVVRNLTLRDITIFGRSYTGSLAGKNSGMIENVNVIGGAITTIPTIPESNLIGGLIGLNFDASIRESSVRTVSIIAHGDFVGGLVGKNENSEIIGSHFKGSVVGVNNVGGLVGHHSRSTSLIFSSSISDSYATGEVSATGTSVGGLVGRNQYATITKSYASVSVQGVSNAETMITKVLGGFVGRSNGGVIEMCYATGDVSILEGPFSSNFYAGGFIGQNFSSIKNNYATGNVEANKDEGVNIGGFAGSNQETIENSYATGDVIIPGRDEVGGFAGSALYKSHIISSYFDATATGISNGIGFSSGANVDLGAFYTDADDNNLVKNADPATGGVAITQSDFSDDPATQDVDESWDFVGNSDDGDKEIWRLSEPGHWPVFAWQE